MTPLAGQTGRADWPVLVDMLRSAVLILLAALGSADQPDTLRQLHLVFRHGQRSPADTYPLDKHINNTFSPYGWGQLTNEGRMQQFKQGEWLKERYNSLLDKGYSVNDVEAWTTDVDRTKMSMQLMMAGLFPPEGEQIWNKDLLWQPISYSFQKLIEDKLLLVRGCPRYSELLKYVLKEPDVIEKMASYHSLYEYLTKQTGMPVTNPDDVQSVYSTLVAERDFGLDLPEWTKDVFPETMSEATAWSFILNAYNRELQRIKGGPLLKKILKDTENVANMQPTKKLFAYAGHDSTISNILLALNVWDIQIPVYNIMAMFEVHQIDDKYGLKVYLRNTTQHEPYLLKIPGCDEFCPLDTFVKLTEEVIPSDIIQECLPKNESYIPPKDHGP